MGAITEENLIKLCPDISQELAKVWCAFLNMIECPEDFQSLQYVLHTLESACLNHPHQFFKTFSIAQSVSSSLFDVFMKVDHDAYPKYSFQKLPHGSKSERPIFSLLFTFSEHFTSKGTLSLLLFLEHYFANEAKIVARGKEEESFRAYRLLYTDQLFEHDCLVGEDAENVAVQLEEYRKHLSTSKDDNDAKRMSNYVRELIHFYRLDWTSRTKRRRKNVSSMRAAYQRSGYERIYGTDNLYTSKLNKPQLSEEEKLTGITVEEDFPPLAFIKTEVTDLAKPRHEMPNKAVIRDSHKERLQQRLIQRDSKKSHNLSLVSRNVLQPYEIQYLVDELLSTRKGSLNGIDKRHVRVIVLLCLILGRSVEGVNTLGVLSTEDFDGEGLYSKSGRWFFKAHHGLTAVLGSQRLNTHLLSAGTEIHIALPSWASEALEQARMPVGSKFLSGSKNHCLIAAVEQLLKSINKKHHCQISIKRIANHLTNYVVARERTDPVLLECLTGKSSYYTRAPRHYMWYSAELVNRKLAELYTEMFSMVQTCQSQLTLELTDDVVDENEQGIGSQFTAKRSSLRQLVKTLQKPLYQTKAFDAASDLHSIVTYHNAYTLYTLYMLLSSTGYRAVGNPLPTFNLYLKRYGALCISDKDNITTFAHMRVVTCTKTLENQLDYYLSHIQAMSRLLTVASPHYSSQYKWQATNSQLLDLKSKNVKLDWFISVKNSKGTDGLFLFFKPNEQQKLVAYNAYPKSVKRYSQHLPDIPMNFGRHYLRLHLQNMGVHQELIKFQLGHWVAGENPLELFSSFAMADSIRTLQPILDTMLSDMGWEAIPSLLTRRRA